MLTAPPRLGLSLAMPTFFHLGQFQRELDCRTVALAKGRAFSRSNDCDPAGQQTIWRPEQIGLISTAVRSWAPGQPTMGSCWCGKRRRLVSQRNNGHKRTQDARYDRFGPDPIVPPGPGRGSPLRNREPRAHSFWASPHHVARGRSSPATGGSLLSEISPTFEESLFGTHFPH
jgi:hypothetical protein